jgi:hypothetical protein
VHSVDYNGSNYIESSHTSFGEESNGRSVLWLRSAGTTEACTALAIQC